MQVFLSDKTVIKLMNESSRMMRVTKQKPKERVMKIPTRTNSDSCIVFKRRNEMALNFEMNKINYLNSVSKSNVSGKEIIKKFDFNFSKSCILLEDSMKNQRSQFLDKLKLKLYQQNIKSDSKYNSRNQSFIKRKTLNPEFNSSSPARLSKKIEEISQPVKKLDFAFLPNIEKEIEKEKNSNEIPFLNFNFNNDNFILKNPKRKLSLFKKDKKQVGTIIESYLNKLHVQFYNNLCEGGMKKTINILSSGFNKKKQYFEEYIDQRIEVEMMIDENPSTLKLKYSFR